MKSKEYTEAVFNYLEYMEYQSLVEPFDARDVAKTLAHAVELGYERDISVRMCAIVIFSHTMNCQVIPRRLEYLSASGKIH